MSAPDKPEECPSCSFKTTELKRYDGDRVWLCDVCAGSLAGNAHLYPRQYESTSTILKTMALMTNMLLAEIKKGARD